MLRDEFILAAAKVDGFIANSKLKKLISAAFERPGEGVDKLKPGDILEAYNQVRTYYDTATNAEREILSAFNLGSLHEARRWEPVFDRETRGDTRSRSWNGIMEFTF